MAKRKSNQTVRVVVMNPEQIPAASEKITELLYESYMEALREGRIEFDKDGNITKVNERTSDK